MIHHVFANKSNVGDWLSALAIQKLLAPHAVVEHLCDEPFAADTLHQLAAAGSDDLIAIGGGGLFMDYFMPFWEGFRSIAGRVPFCLWGVGCCDLKREQTRPPSELLRSIVSRSRLCVVRDELSRDYLGGVSLPRPASCPSLAAVETYPPGAGVLHVDNYTTAGAEVYEAMDEYARRFARDTRRPYLKTNNRIANGNSTALAATLRQYAAADIVLSSALHGCVIAVAMGRKVLAVSGDRKIEAFMQAAGLGDWVCAQEEVDAVPERLREVARQVWPADFLRQTRRAHAAIAAEVLAIAGLPAGPCQRRPFCP